MCQNKKFSPFFGVVIVAMVCALLVLASGCKSTKISTDKIDAQDVFAGTIATVGELTGFSRIRIQGYSLVWGLPNTGSSECPPAIKEHLLDILRKADIAALMGPFYAGLKRNEIIEHRTTAVVHVTAWVPAGAPKNAPFDVTVTALSATQTTSLKSGNLFPVELRFISDSGSSGFLAGLPVAIASGPVYVNALPPDSENNFSPALDSRQGQVIGGGRSLRDRNIQLVLYKPSYRLAQQVQNRINARFSSQDEPRVADGLNRNIIRITIPDEYQDRYQHFISLVLALYLDSQLGFLDAKISELDQLALQDNDHLSSVALAWESIGRTCLDSLRAFYNQHEGPLAYYAARTAVNLNDLQAIDKLIDIAQDANHPNRSDAANELIRFPADLKVRQCFIEMLDSDSEQMRLLAYRGLRKMDDGFITSVKLPGGFVVDHVRSKGEQQLCVWLYNEPRIVLFGPDIQCPQNLFFESSDQKITVNAKPDDNTMTIFRHFDKQGQFIRLSSSYDVAEFINVLAQPLRHQDSKKPRGAGLSFSEIVGLLYEMCREDGRVLPIKFKLYRHRQGSAA